MKHCVIAFITEIQFFVSYLNLCVLFSSLYFINVFIILLTVWIIWKSSTMEECYKDSISNCSKDKNLVLIRIDRWK